MTRSKSAGSYVPAEGRGNGAPDSNPSRSDGAATMEDAATRSEGIQAMLYPNLERFKQEDASKPIDWSGITDKLKHIVNEVNQKLLPYQRISKMTVLKERLEETTTKKVKRFKVKK